jgi:phenylacetate-CoA ligase
MGTLEVIKKFIESNWIIEKAARELIERLPLKFRYGISYGPTFRHWLGFLKESEKWDRDRLARYQIEQLRDLLIHAGKNVPYYKTIFEEYGFKPERFQSLDDIKILPYLDRMTIHEKKEQFIAGNMPGRAFIPTYTSGTSGIPLVIYATKETEEKHWATIVDLWGRIGYTPKSKVVFFVANIRRGNRENLPWNKYSNTLVLSSNYFVNEWMDRYMEIIDTFKPEYLIGFPHTIAVFCSYMGKSKRKFILDSLKGVIVYAENVYEWQMEIIKEVLGVRVFSDYGMVEKVIHGGACEHSTTFHLYPQYGFTEYLHLHDAMCELVGTGFINYAMPLIRYKTGDLCAEIRGTCAECGRNYDTITRIEGRMGDFLITSDENIVSVYLDIDFSVFERIKRFQLYQDLPGKVALRIWPEDSFHIDDTQRILHEIKRSLGSNASRITFDIVLLDDVDVQPAGKFRMVEQQLNIRSFLKFL